MVNNVKAGYVNPLTMMKNSRQGKLLNPGMIKTEEKNRKSLEAKKQSIQNSLLLMKGTSGNGGTSEENIERLEKELEEITNEIKTASKELDAVVTVEEDKSRQYEDKTQKEEKTNMLPRRDTVTISSMAGISNQSEADTTLGEDGRLRTKFGKKSVR